MELIVKNDLSFNFEELKQELKTQLKKYENIVVTDELSAKADRATLNKFKKAIEDKRKEVKKEFLKPYEEFELKIKEIVALIDKPIKTIDEQLYTMREIENAKKQEKIIIIYKSLVGDYKDLFSIDKFYDRKWLNKTYKIIDIQKELSEKIEKAKKDFALLKDMKLSNEKEAINEFLNTLSLQNAIEINKKIAEQQEKIKTVTTKPVEKSTKQYQVDFRVYGTEEQIKMLKEFLNNNKIKYGRVN